jgi:hypothetical protein
VAGAAGDGTEVVGSAGDEGLAVDPAQPETMTMSPAVTRDRFDTMPVVAMSWLSPLRATRWLLGPGLMIDF